MRLLRRRVISRAWSWACEIAGMGIIAGGLTWWVHPLAGIVLAGLWLLVLAFASRGE